jgi:hypothetical protein
MYVNCLHIGRIRMDIDNSGVTWDLNNTCKASTVIQHIDQTLQIV